MNILFEIYNYLPQQGPGDNKSTRRAFSMLRDLPHRPVILDIGCGNGRQTLELAKISNGNITALDNHQRFLDKLMSKASKQDLDDKIKIVNGSMFSLPFKHNSFDLIWSEGAIYLIGLGKGLKTWKPFLKDNGYIAITDLTWLKNSIPSELKKYWKKILPEIGTIDKNLEIIKTLGFVQLGHFTLLKSAWWDNYYIPMKKQISKLKKKYKSNSKILQVLDQEAKEIDIYEKYSKYYGYVFYLMKTDNNSTAPNLV